MKKIRTILTSLLIISGLVANAQSLYTYITGADSIDLRKEWFLLDPEMDRVQGVSVERAYKLLECKPSCTVVVAVMDSGVDIDHEDLKDVIWVNEDEIPGNGVDDGKNGYVDDVHGWNFIGDVHADTYELTREYARLRAKYDTDETRKIRKKEKAEYEYWLMIKDRFEDRKSVV